MTTYRLRPDVLLRYQDGGDRPPGVTATTVNTVVPIVPNDILSCLHEGEPIAESECTTVIGLGEYVIKIAIEKEAACLRNEVFVAKSLERLQNKRFCRVHSYSANQTSSFYPANSGKTEVAVFYKIDGISLLEFLQDASLHDSFLVLKEIIGALYQANERLGFTHYDLHLKNIMVEYDGTPVIIDYGYSYLRSEDISLGMVLAEGAIRPETNWAHDILKLLCSYWILEGNGGTPSPLETVKSRGEFVRCRLDTLTMEEIDRWMEELEKTNECTVAYEKIRRDYRELLESCSVDTTQPNDLLDRSRRLLFQVLNERSDWKKHVESLKRLISPLIEYFSIGESRGGTSSTTVEVSSIIRRLKLLSPYYCVFVEEMVFGSFEEFLRLMESV